MGWVYIIHFDQKVGHAGHYCGYTSKGIRRRIASHRETTWTPYDEPVRTDDGRVIAGEKHGPGALLMGVVNSKGIPWEVARIFRNVTRAFERRIKNTKHIARYCPICNPNARDYQPKGANS